MGLDSNKLTLGYDLDIPLNKLTFCSTDWVAGGAHC